VPSLLACQLAEKREGSASAVLIQLLIQGAAILAAYPGRHREAPTVPKVFFLAELRRPAPISRLQPTRCLCEKRRPP